MEKPVSMETVVVNASDAKSEVLHVRMSAGEMARIRDAAKQADLTVSAFMRSLALEAAGIRPFFTEADRAVLDLLLADIKAIGVKLNQFTRAVNHRQAVLPHEERVVIGDVHRTVAALLLELVSFAERGTRSRRGKV